MVQCRASTDSSTSPLTLRSSDVPGSPPTWFVHRKVDSLLETPEFSGQFYIHGLPSGVECTPVQLMQQAHDAIIDSLISGKTAYIDLYEFQRDNPAMYRSVDDARSFLESTESIEVVNTFALSEAWMSNFSKECVASMARDGDVDFGVSASESQTSVLC